MKEYAIHKDAVRYVEEHVHEGRKILSDPVEDAIYKSILHEVAGYGPDQFAISRNDVILQFGEVGFKVLNTLEKDGLIVSQEA